MLTYTHTMHAYSIQSQAQEYKLVFSHSHRVSDLERSPTGSVFRTRRHLHGECDQDRTHLQSYRVSAGQRLSQVSAHSRTHPAVNDQLRTLLWSHDLDREPTYRVRNEYRGSSSGSLIRNDTHFRVGDKDGDCCIESPLRLEHSIQQGNRKANNLK